MINKILVFLILIAIVTQRLIRIKANGTIETGFLITLYIGQPSLPSNVILDTGSSMTVISCTNCIKCNGKQQTYYNFQKSLTSHLALCNNQQQICKNKCLRTQEYCTFDIYYLQGTQIFGKIIKDKISFNSDFSQSFPSYFGCIDIQNSVHDEKKPENILGLQPAPEENALYNLFREDSTLQYQFSTCLTEYQGFLQVGVNQNDSLIKPTWTSRFDTSTGRYNIIDINSLRFGSINILQKIGVHHIVIDTGSSHIVMPSQIYSLIRSQIFARCKKARGQQCVYQQVDTTLPIVIAIAGSKPSNKTLNQMFKSIQLTVNGVKTEIKPSDYFRFVRQESGYFIYMTWMTSISEKDKSGLFIFGIIWMQNIKLTFNLKEQTIRAYYNYNCIYQPAPNQNQLSLTETIISLWNTIKTIKTQYLVILLLVLSFLAYIIKTHFQKIKIKITNIKQYLVNKCKKKKRSRKPNKSTIQLNQQSCRQQKSEDHPQQKSDDQPHQKPATPNHPKQRRGRNRSLRYK